MSPSRQARLRLLPHLPSLRRQGGWYHGCLNAFLISAMTGRHVSTYRHLRAVCGHSYLLPGSGCSAHTLYFHAHGCYCRCFRFFDNHMDLMYWTMTSNRHRQLLLKVRQCYPCYFATASQRLRDWRLHLLREVYMEAWVHGRSSSVLGGSSEEGFLAVLDFWLSR